MKNNYGVAHTGFILLFLMIRTFNMHAQGWTRKADLSAEREQTSSFAIDGKFYISGGFNRNTNIYFNDLWQYDPDTDAWTQQANVPSAHNGCRSSVGFAIDGKGYVGLGVNVSQVFSKELWEYDAVDDTWLQKTDLPATGREGAACFVVNDKAYIVGGAEISRYSQVWEYDPANDAWTLKGAYPSGPIISAAAFSINGKGYVTCGYPGNNVSRFTYEYAPLTNQWTRKADFKGAARFDLVAFTLYNKGYCGLGSTFGNRFYDFYSYDPVTDSWTDEDNFPGQGADMSIGISDGTIAYVGGGSDSNGGDTRQFYEFAAADFTALKKNTAASTIGCYPNPVSDRIFFKNKELKEGLLYTLYSLDGKVVLEGKVMNNSIKVDALAAGSYILNLDLNGQHTTQRINIEK